MRRADRLFRIVQLLRAGRLSTARSLAQKLEVSERTIYRDIQELQLSGMPIEGEAGVGYTLRRDFDIPPLMFDRQEITALVLGARMVKAWGGTEMAEAANNALRKIEVVLPPDLRDRIDQVQLYAPGFRVSKELRHRLDSLHHAAIDRSVLDVEYTSEAGDLTRRRIRPLALVSGAVPGLSSAGANSVRTSAAFVSTGCSSSPYWTRYLHRRPVRHWPIS